MSDPIWRDQDMEAAVLGAMFLRGPDNEVMDVISTLPESVFSYHQYREIYRAIISQAKGKGIIDPLLIGEALPEHQALIDSTARVVWAKSSLKSYARQLVQNAALREAQSALGEAVNRLLRATNSDEGVRILAEVKATVSAIQTESDAIRPVALDELLPVIINRINDRMESDSAGRTVMTGIDELDEVTGGFDQTDLILLAARPSMGKTELILDIMENLTASGAGVLFFSMEMSDIQIAERHVAAASGLSASRLKSPEKLEDEDWARIGNGISRMTGRKIWVVDSNNLTVDQIQSIATRHIQQHPETALVAIDYLRLIKLQSTSRHDLAVGEVSKGLKSLAKINRRPVVALSQLSRSVESRINKRPVNADLKDSGEIEADADIIMMLYRDEVYNPESPAVGIAEINITKNRNGPLGTVYRRFWNGHFHHIDQVEARNRSIEQPEAKSSNKRYSKGGAA
ncbi:replicative DNA helicase [Pantoea dispersa]|uniref:replicative DNA helicase n=1 Tax=Pantoea dispersa TaxID=59814 RepID=UPI000FDC6215|nr:replicative DNA helicase [Pantoea dispersa]MDR6298252.1 replicative DNA helicase [Pantoea dispersa]RVU75168.1 replicative DNA helicase [Pantoea dispersa]